MSNMVDCKFMKEHVKWLVLLINGVLFVLMAWLLPVHFEENDDVVMCMIANGVYSGTPDGHLVFVNALYGWMLAGLYRLTKAVEWYTLSFCILHVLAMVGISCAILRDKEMKPLHKGLCLVFFYVIWVRIIIGFQFTSTAGLLCFSGCLALLQPTRKWKIAGICAIFVASLIRFKAAALVGILCAPLLLTKVVEERRYIFWLVGVALLAIMGRWADGMFYRQPDWAYYKAYNAVRGFINDNPNATLAENNLPDGVELQDYQMFCSFEGDPEIMTLPKLRMIKAEIEGGMSFRQAVINLVQLRMYRIPLFLVYFGLLLCIVINDKRFTISPHYIHLGRVRLNVKMMVLVSSCLLMTFILVYLGATASLKNRVFLCLLFPIVYLLASSWPKEKARYKVLFQLSLVLVLSGMIIKYAWQDVKVRRLVQSNQKEFDEYQYPLVKDLDGILYFGAFHSEYLPSFGIKDLKFRCAGLGWTTCIPFQKGLLDCHRDFIDSNVLIFGRLDSPPERLVEMIKKNYGISSQSVIVEKNDQYALYKIVMK